MKKVLLASALLASLAALPVKAAQFWYDVITNYPGGCISTNSDGLWYAHPPGSLTATDMLIVTNSYTSGAAVSGKMLRVNGLNSEYVMRLFDSVNTNSISSGVVYASFIANANFVPAAGKGTYFAGFNGVYPNPPDGTSATNSFQFRGRVYEIGNTNAWPYTTTVPLTYRFGLSNAENDPAQDNPGPWGYVPIDLIKNVDYQVVLKYDMDLVVASMWVNPASESDTANMIGPTSDLGAITNGLAGLLFRQRTGGGTVDIRDVVVGTTFADVMTNSAATSPVLVATNYHTVSTYAGNPALLEVFGTSIGGGPLNYRWYQIVPDVSTNAVGANSQTYLVPSLSGSDAGYYFCAVTNSGGSGELSGTNFQITVNTTPTPPGFTTKPTATVFGAIGGSLTLSCAAFGTGPLTYQWAFNGTPLIDGQPVTAGDGSVVAGSQTPTLKVSLLSTNETGNFTVTVTGGASPATNATSVVSVSPPKPVSIAYLRSLEDTNTWQATDTTSLYSVVGVVTMYTNVVGSGNTSFYIQDATGGIDFFLTANTTFRPQMGDIVSATGTLSMYNNAIELWCNNPANPACAFANLGNVGHTNLLPTPYVFNLALTNNAGWMETNIEGRVCMLTNVWFTTLPASATASYNTYVTNESGGPALNVFWPAGTDPDVQNQTLSTRFAYTITGVMAQYRSGAYSPAGYELYVTRIGDIQTNPPPDVTATATVSRNDVVLAWEAVPYTIDARGAYSYSVLSATDVGGPYLPLATGMAFSTTNGVYTDTNALLGGQKFYRISSP